MFLFSRKTKTPISTYSDSYRAPTSIKEVYKDPPLWAWEANKFVTPGLTHAMQRHMDPDALQKVDRSATQDYTYKNSIPSHPYLPERYWFSQDEEDKYCPRYLGGDRYNSWKIGPYDSPYWNKYSSYLPRLSKDSRMNPVARGMPLEYPPKPERLNAYEREVVMNMLNSLSRTQPLPQIAPRCGCGDPLSSRLPFQGFDSPCTGRHYCLRGLDTYCAPERRLSPMCMEEPTVRSVLPCGHRPGMQCILTTPLPSYYPFPNLRWDTSHFKKTGGPQRNNFVVHPEFVSENCPHYYYW